MLDHLAFFPITAGTIPKPLAAYGATAVVIFFVLSGYVISYVTESREKTAGAYYSSRISRLYSVAIPALVFTACLDFLGSHLHPDFYASPKILPSAPTVLSYLSSLTFTNEYLVFGTSGFTPGTNNPYWSLSFEATYYLVAGLIIFNRRWIGVLASLIVLALAGRTIFALFPIWIGGFYLYRSRLRFKSQRTAWVMALVSLVIIAASPAVSHVITSDDLGIWLPWGRRPFNRDVLTDYAAASAFSLHLIAMRSIRSIAFIERKPVEKAIRWAGSLTFPLYLFHFPAASFFASISPWKSTTYLHLIFVVAFVLCTVVVASYACEFLRVFMRKTISTCRLPEKLIQTSG